MSCKFVDLQYQEEPAEQGVGNSEQKFGANVMRLEVHLTKGRIYSPGQYEEPNTKGKRSCLLPGYGIHRTVNGSGAVCWRV